MTYELDYRNDENHIFIPEWENKDIKNVPDYNYSYEETEDRYYYKIEIGSTWDDNFGELIVRKVSVQDDEVCEKMEEYEIEAILAYVGQVCFE